MLDYIHYRGETLLPAKSDIVFKAIFGKEENKDILANFLSGMLDLPLYAPEQITFTNVELSPEYAQDKRSLLDVRIATGGNEHINIEIQIADNGDMAPRCLYYLSRLYASQMAKGKGYGEIGRTIGLSIVDFAMFEDDRPYRSFRMLDRETGAELSDRMELDFVELVKIADDTAEGKTLKECWMLFLSTSDGEVLEMLSNQNAEMQKAFDKLQYVSKSENMRRLFEERHKVEMDRIAGQRDWELRGMRVGMEKGMAQGMAQGMAIGEATALKRVIRQMLVDGMSTELIYKYANAPKGDVDAHIAEIQNDLRGGG